MYFTLTSSRDTYITDKIIEGNFSASNANVGRASTLDLFRLYNESSLTGTDVTTELSRVLIKFDYDRIKKLQHDSLDLNSSNFECRLEMFDIMGGQVTPTNFTLILFPLSQSFDEGRGKDVIGFGDLDTANFITASVSNGTVNAWHTSGANAQGKIDKTSSTGYPTNIDIIVSGNLNDGEGTVGLGAKQLFIRGNEDLSIDVTKVVSATIAGILPNHGFRLSFTGSEESDNKTRFVKRFASRHVRNQMLKPRLAISYDNIINDNHRNFEFDVTGTLFLNNFHHGKRANILSGASIIAVTGANCIMLTVRTGSFVRIFSASQHQAGTKQLYSDKGGESYNYVTGVYSASFAIPFSDTTTVSFNTTMTQMAARTGSIMFETYWSSTQQNPPERVGYHTGSLTVTAPSRSAFDYLGKEIDLIVTNARSTYSTTELVQFRAFGREFSRKERAHKIPYRENSLIFNEVYYRVLDVDTKKIVIPFKRDNNGTRLSSDSGGMWFELYMDTLPIGRNYTMEFLVADHGSEEIIEAKNVNFRVTS